MKYNAFGFALAAIIVAGCTQQQPNSPTPPDTPSPESALGSEKNGAPLSSAKETSEVSLAKAIHLMAAIDDDIEARGLDEDDARRFRARFRGQLAASGIEVDTIKNWVEGSIR